MIPITKQDFKTYNRQISNNIHVDVFNMHVADAQLLDLQELLGIRFYEDIINNQADYTELIDGGTYEYNGITYTNVGLKSVIVYFAHARVMFYGSEINTAFGQVNKNEQSSTQSSTEIKKQFYKSNREGANRMFMNVREYMIRMNIDGFHCGLKKGLTAFKFYKVGR